MARSLPPRTLRARASLPSTAPATGRCPSRRGRCGSATSSSSAPVLRAKAGGCVRVRVLTDARRVALAARQRAAGVGKAPVFRIRAPEAAGALPARRLGERSRAPAQSSSWRGDDAPDAGSSSRSRSRSCSRSPRWSGAGGTTSRRRPKEVRGSSTVEFVPRRPARTKPPARRRSSRRFPGRPTATTTSAPISRPFKHRPPYRQLWTAAGPLVRRVPAGRRLREGVRQPAQGRLLRGRREDGRLALEAEVPVLLGGVADASRDGLVIETFIPDALHAGPARRARGS